MVYDPKQGCVRGEDDPPITFSTVKDSGEHRETSTGAVRDRQAGKGRYDLITPIGLKRLALHYENGAKKYSERNWEKGMPLSWFIDSAIRHIYSYLSGDRSEDNWAAVAWNALGFIHMEEMIRQGRLPKELDDIGVVPHKEYSELFISKDQRNKL